MIQLGPYTWKEIVDGVEKQFGSFDENQKQTLDKLKLMIKLPSSFAKYDLNDFRGLSNLGQEEKYAIEAIEQWIQQQGESLFCQLNRLVTSH